MSDEKRDEKPTAQEQDLDSNEPAAAASVKRGTSFILLLIILSLAWYLVSDRFTPYTSQARVQGYIVGVAPKVAGVVTHVWVNNNQEVEAAQPLFEIDSSQYRIALKRAQSDLANAQTQVDAGSAVVESARASLRAALANETKAEKDSNRLKRLYREDPGTISVRRLEVSQATLDQARAQVSAAESDIQRAIEQKGGEDDETNSILKSAESAVEKAELDLANTVVRASSRGVITDLNADVGQYAGTGSPVLTLVAIHDVWISAEFTENNLGHLQAGSPVEILFDAMPGQVFDGQIRSIGLGVGAGQAQSTPGTLPTVENSRDWLRQSQRFPVIIGFETAPYETLRRQLRVGGQASVIAYSDGHDLLGLLGKAYIRLMSYLSYAY
ncbi:MAG: HlyD family secretion protein [Gammaproteobacteria bacterium]|nr:HlyD family secretion protein [Gammaproteobacteria bacterium]